MRQREGPFGAFRYGNRDKRDTMRVRAIGEGMFVPTLQAAFLPEAICFVERESPTDPNSQREQRKHPREVSRTNGIRGRKGRRDNLTRHVDP